MIKGMIWLCGTLVLCLAWRSKVFLPTWSGFSMYLDDVMIFLPHWQREISEGGLLSDVSIQVYVVHFVPCSSVRELSQR